MSAHDPLAAAHAVAAAEETASVVRHDLRNRLAAIRGAAFFLQRRVSETDLWRGDARVPELFSAITEEVDRATLELSDRMAMSHLLARDVARISAASAARAAAGWARIQGRHGVVVEIRAGDGEVVADGTELALAVRCLIENAAEAMTSGGVITVVVERSGPEVLIDVSDGGPGFSAAARTRAAEPFFTTKEGHAGLGMSIAQRVCRRYGGRLAVGAPESGAQVCIHLPAAEARAP